MVTRWNFGCGVCETSPELPLRRVRAAAITWLTSSSPSSSSNAYTTQVVQSSLRARMGFGERGAGDGLSFLRLVAPIELVFPQVPFRTTKIGDKVLLAWPFFFLSSSCISTAIQKKLAAW